MKALAESAAFNLSLSTSPRSILTSANLTQAQAKVISHRASRILALLEFTTTPPIKIRPCVITTGYFCWIKPHEYGNTVKSPLLEKWLEDILLCVSHDA